MIFIILNILKLIVFDENAISNILIICFLTLLININYNKAKILILLSELSFGVPLIIDSISSIYSFNYDIILNCHICTLVGVFIYLSFFDNKKNVINYEIKKDVSNKFINNIILFSFIVSITADVLGISKMGIENDIVLPFKLKGLINYLHFEVIPFLYLIIVDNSRKKYIYIFILVWATYESILRGSRGFFVTFMAQVLVIYNIRNKITKNIYKPFIKYLPIAILIILFFTVKRYELTLADLMSNYELLIKFLNLIYNRVFSICLNSSEMITYFNNYPTGLIDIINQGSFSMFNTNIIGNLEAIKETHSSGSSYYAEFYFFFGYYGVVFGAMILSYYIFNLRNTISANSIRVYFDFFVVFQFLNGGLITLLFFRPERIIIIVFLFIIYNFLIKIGTISKKNSHEHSY